MLLELDHHSGIPIFRQVIGQIRQQIMTGILAQDDQLETVRDLAARLKVNPMTISKAYSFLEAEGLVARRRGVGLFVAQVKTTKRQQIKRELLNNVMEKAVVCALQFGVSETEAIDLLKQRYRLHNSKGRS